MKKCFLRLQVALPLCLLALFAFAPLARSGGLDAFRNDKGEINVSGGTAHIPVMKEAAKRIMTANREVRVTIAGGGSGVGIKQVGEGLVDIGNSGRAPTEQEIRQYSLHVFQWAIDGVGVVVNKGNPVKSLKKEELKKIFSGEINNWKTLGGQDRPINIYNRDEASGTREVFWEKGLEKGNISLKANVVVSNGAMKSAVANDLYAIGYVSVGHIDESIAPVALEGVLPTIGNVKSGAHKISRGLYSNTKGKPQGLTGKFIDYLFTGEGQKIVTDHGFIAVK